MENLQRELWVDRVGTKVSFLCAMHCLATPIFMILAPLGLDHARGGETLEKGFIGASLALAVTSGCWGAQLHHQKRVLWIFGLSLASILIGHAIPQGAWETVFVVLGGFGVVTGHLVNRKLCKDCFLCAKPSERAA